VCSGDLCIQRITSIVNGKANVKAWAWRTNFTGTFYLSGNGYFGQSPTHGWTAGGAGYVFLNVPQGDGYTATQWTTGNSEIGLVTFRV
jgi:hypothetical protein